MGSYERFSRPLPASPGEVGVTRDRGSGVVENQGTSGGLAGIAAGAAGVGRAGRSSAGASGAGGIRAGGGDARDAGGIAGAICQGGPRSMGSDGGATDTDAGAGSGGDPSFSTGDQCARNWQIALIASATGSTAPPATSCLSVMVGSSWVTTVRARIRRSCCSLRGGHHD